MSTTKAGRFSFSSLAIGLLLLPAMSLIAGETACRIEVVDKSNGWPVPLVELRTTHLARLVTDNAGVIAFDLPELMGRETWFDVLGHGYEVPKGMTGTDGDVWRWLSAVPIPVTE